MFMTLTRELVQYFYPIYVTTSQKADICNGFQVITRTDTHTHTHTHTHTQTSTKSIIYARVHDNCMTI